MRHVRCAIYTRKSSEEGLEQGFNSLDAQREACAAYILSQASEGWQLVPECYDDGGLSGGTLERPALQRLLGDVAAGRIDIIVAYKVDRLTRSLLDFAKLVEAFDKTGTSFVSITQSFNTTTSMGRLTLNMLLSFAQFEREVTAERIRDKIAASKAKGMWMGGTPPLGYRPDGRTLAIIDDHAELVRTIFRRYLELGTVRQLADELVAKRVTTPMRERSNGRPFGGVPFSRGQLYKILSNPIYTGRIAHRDKLYAGQHRAIIDNQTWERTQAMLQSHVKGTRTVRRPHASPLAGMIYSADGEPLIANHACKPVLPGVTSGKQRYRYYVSKAGVGAATTPADSPPSLRLPAGEIELLVTQQLAGLFDDPIDLAARTGCAMTPTQLATLRDRGNEAAAALRGRQNHTLHEILARVTVHEDRVEIVLDVAAVANKLGLTAAEVTSPTMAVTVPARLTRTGRTIRLVESGGGNAVAAVPDSGLVRLIAKAHRWWRTLSNGEMDIGELANAEDVSSSYLTRVVRLAFLAPDVIDAIVCGRARAGIDATALLATGAIDPRWEKQRAVMLPA